MGSKQFYVYMMASGKRGTIYTGVTSDLVSRVIQRRRGWKVELIQENNPNCRDLWADIAQL